MQLCKFSSFYLQYASLECWVFKPIHDVVDIGQSFIQKVHKGVTIKTALKYLWSITVGVVFFVSVQSITKDGPTGGSLFGYVLAFLYVIFRWNISQKPLEIFNKPLIWVVRAFVILCSILLFAGLSSMHGGSEEGKTFAAIIALIFSVETGRQYKRVSSATIGV